MMTTSRFALIALFVIGVTRLEAGIIYDNGPLALGGANEIGVQSDGDFQLADDFVLTVGDTITDVHWWSTNSLGVDNFTIQFYEDDNGKPADNPFIDLAIGDVVEMPVSFGAPFDNVFEYWVDINPITLQLGVTYWISILNDSALPTWFWASAGVGNVQSRTPTTDWAPPTFATSEMGFVLTDDGLIPEPSSLFLLATGMAGLARARRKGARSRGTRSA